MNTVPSTARYRPVNFGVTRVNLRDGAPGVRYLQADLPLGAFARRVTDYLVHWAEARPTSPFWHAVSSWREARRVTGSM